MPQPTNWTPHDPALITPQQRWSYTQMARWVESITKKVEQLGLLEGEQVVLWAEASPLALACFFGLLRRGCIVAPLSTRIPQEQLFPMARKISARHLFVDDALAEKAQHPEFCVHLLSSLPPPTQEPQHQNNDPKTPRVEEIPSAEEIPTAAEIPRVEDANDAPAWMFAFPKEGLERDATIIFTSGSTREPKAALHSYANHYYSALGSNQNIPIEPQDRWLLSLPIFHVAGIGLIMRVFLAGASVAIPSPRSSLHEAIRAMQPTHLSLVPTQLLRLLDAEPAILPQLQQARAILLGGSAIPYALLERAASLRLRIFTSYGSTEMASQITTTRPIDGLDAWSSSGLLLPYRALRLAEDGEIWVRGETRFRGYLTPEGLQCPFDADGWFAMGDLGRMDDNGFLHILGRKDAMFISGGENIQPEEIEWHLAQHPAVESVLVVDVPHALYGARPVAFLQMRDAQPLCEKTLREFLSSRIARFKIPDHFLPWPALPPHPSIKPSRSVFRQYAHTHLSAFSEASCL